MAYTKEQMIAWRLKNAEDIIAKRKIYYAKNKEKILAQSKLYNSIPDVKLKKNAASRKHHEKIKISVNERRRELFKIKMKNPEYVAKRRLKTKTWRLNNKDKSKTFRHKSDKKQWEKIKSNPEAKAQYLESGRKYHSKNKDKLNARRRELYRIKIQNPEYAEYRKKRDDEWRKNNMDKVRISRKKSLLKIRPKIYEYTKNRIKNNPLLRLRRNLHSSISRYFKSKTNSRCLDKENLLGADRETIKAHLERQFKKGMTWENYGHKTWHIDHIIPLASAKNEEELRRLFHYTNTQPLWAKENIAKRDKIIKPIQMKMTI